MKILYVVSTLANSGPTNQIFNLISELSTNNDIVLVTLSPEPEDSQKERFLSLGIKLKPLNLNRISGMIFAKKELDKVIEEIKPNIMHTQGIRADGLGVKYSKSNLKVVSTIRNFPSDDYPMKFGKVLGSLMAKKHINVIKKMYKPVVCSYSLGKGFSESMNMNFDVIQNGVNIKEFQNINENEKEKVREQLNIPLEKNVFVSTGSLIDRKSPQTIIEAFIKKTKQDSELLYMIGDGPLLEECKNIATGYNNIVFPGNVNNVVKYLQASDYFISASLSEGLPNSVLESLSVGLPVCISDIEPHKEILGFDSSVGISFTRENINDLIKKINKLEERDYEYMRNAAVNMVKENLSSSVMANQYISLYEDLIAKK